MSANIKKISLTGIFIAISVIGSLFSFPVFGSKCAPAQHLMNIMGAVFLGPGYALAAAFLSSLIRNMLGLGTLLAFPGSMCGAFLAGVLYRGGKKLPYAYGGEVFGTALVGGILAYPIAKIVLGNGQAAIFTFVVPFFNSTCGGTLLAVVLVGAMKKSGVIDRLLQEVT